MLKKLLKQDFIQGYKSNIGKILFFMAIAVFSCIDFENQREIVYYNEQEVPVVSCMDFLMYLFAGMKPYVPSPTEGFSFPIKWFLLYSLLFYSTLYFPQKDLQTTGINVMARTGKRISWWISKCIWNGSFVLLAYIAMIGTVVTFCAWKDVPIEMDLSMISIVDILRVEEPFHMIQKEAILTLTVLPFVTAMGISLFEMTLTLFVNPLFAFLIVEVVLVASAYSTVGIFVGNYMMAVRSEFILEEGYVMWQGFAIVGGLIVASIFIGCLKFKRYDL